MNNNSGRWKGHAAMLVANVVWGAMSPVTKDLLLSETITPAALSAIRIAGGAALFWLFTLILPARMIPSEKIDRADWPMIILASVLMISANQGLFILGIGYTSPIDSSVMSALTPVITMVLAALLIHQPITMLKAVGVILGLGGAVIMVLANATGSAIASNPMLGDSLCLAAQFCAALYYVKFVNIIKRYSPFTMMKWMFTFASLTYVPCIMPWVLEVDFRTLPTKIWFELAYIICLATFLAYLLIPYSQRYLRPSVIAMYNYLQPATAALLATILGVSAFGPLKIFATAMIFAGVWFVTRSKGSTPVNEEAD
ncbi:MAG: DMT family transporter [Muribaculaceae bacterium]|nr:DMT family transporter [Muribaculaceae bacterium]